MMSVEKSSVCLNIIAGCYERTVLGYEVTVNDKDETYSIDAQFTDNSHIGYVKTIAASHNYLASGSTDETIHLYNLKNNIELGTLLQHDGSITCLCFHGNSHMVSSSEDGTLCLWDTKSWDCMKVLKGHKGGVNSIAIHPSGKLALSVGVDKTLRTWNLLKGRAAYTTNIKQVADHVLWSPDGEMYVVVIGGVINVYNITTASIVCTTNCKKRINAVTFVTNRVFAVGGEGNSISLFEIKSAGLSCIHVLEDAHENRIKGLQCVSACSVSGKPCTFQKWLVSASSDGYIKLWGLDTNKLREEPSLLAEVSTTARLTCVTVRPTGKVHETEKLKPKTSSKVTTEIDEVKSSPKQTSGKRIKAASEHTGGKSKKKKTQL